MKFKFIGIGAAGNKAALELVNSGVATSQEIILVNSTNKDIPKGFDGKIIIITDDNAGAGKERSIAHEYAMTALQNGKFDDVIEDYVDSVVIVTSVEGGTGSGSAPVITKYINKVLGKNIHIVAFMGFEDDTRGLENTIDFFKEIDFGADVQCIRNSSFMAQAEDNRLKAEELANKEFVDRMRIMKAIDLVDSVQNMDETDLYKVINSIGYKVIETYRFRKNLIDQSDFNKVIRNMILNSHSMKSKGASRIGVILNINKASEDAVDFSFASIKEEYGEPFEIFNHIQNTEGEQSITYICSGMKMPLEEVKEIFERYKERTAEVDKSADNFFNEINQFKKEDEDSKFDMVRTSSNRSTTSKEDFFGSL